MITAAMLASAPAVAQVWRDVPGGKQNERATVCPAVAGKFVLSETAVNDDGYYCNYEYHCEAPANCETELGFASIIDLRIVNYDSRFLESMTEKGYISSDAGPVIAGIKPSQYGAVEIDGNKAAMGHWRLSIGAFPSSVQVAGEFSESAAPSIYALVEEALRLNPKTGEWPQS